MISILEGHIFYLSFIQIHDFAVFLCEIIFQVNYIFKSNQIAVSLVSPPQVDWLLNEWTRFRFNIVLPMWRIFVSVEWYPTVSINYWLRFQISLNFRLISNYKWRKTSWQIIWKWIQLYLSKFLLFKIVSIYFFSNIVEAQ